MSLAGSLAERLVKRWYSNRGAPWLLLPFEALFRFVAAIRKRAIKPQTLPVPVIVVGNLSVGGTGKTPVVVWAVQQLTAAGYKPGVISRGYGGQAESWPQTVNAQSDPAMVGDEPVLIARRCGCPVVVGPQRIEAARQLLAGHDVNVIISDDGLQHYRLPRHKEIVVVDGERGFGNRHCLPAGPLREPLNRLQAIDMIIVNGGSLRLPDGGPFSTLMVLQQGKAVNLKSGEQRQLNEFSNVHALAGIGNPQRFFSQLQSKGIDVKAHAFPDHHDYAAGDFAFADNAPLLMTEKDAVKITALAELNLDNFWYVPVDALLLDEAAELLKGWMNEPN